MTHLRLGVLIASLLLLATAAPAHSASRVVAITAAPASAAAGSSLGISVSVRNPAKRAAGSGRVVVLLSADAKADAKDRRVATAKLPALKPRARRVVKVRAALPPSVAGSRRLLACAAPRNGRLPRRAKCASRVLRIVAADAAPAPGSPAAPAGTPAPAPTPQPPVAPTPFPEVGGIDPAVPVEEPAPRAPVGRTLDSAASKRAVIGPDGGTLTITHPGGGTSTLSVPAGALLGRRMITATPISAVEGLPFAGGLVMGLELTPHGLRFQKPVTLSFAPASPVPLGEQTPLLFHEGGKDLHLYPLAADPSKLEMELMHFSDPVVARGTPEERQAQMASPPANPEAQIEQQAAAVRQALRSGDGTAAVEKFRAYARSYWEKVVLPRMIAAETDDTLAAVAVDGFLAWQRSLDLVGVQGEFEPEIAGGMERLAAILRFAYDRAYERCLAGDLSYANRIIAIMRQRLLMGLAGEDDVPEAFDRYKECVTHSVIVDGLWVYAHTDYYGNVRTHRIHERTVIPFKPEAGIMTGTGDWQTLEWTIQDASNCADKPTGSEQLMPARAELILPLDSEQETDESGKASAVPPSLTQPSVIFRPGQTKHSWETYNCATGGWYGGFVGDFYTVHQPRYFNDSGHAAFIFQKPDWLPGELPVLARFDHQHHREHSNGSSVYDVTTRIEFRQTEGS